MEKIRQIWENPPESAKGMTRWWWYGCAVTKEEIQRELNLMKEAGIGGVEIQILYPVTADDGKKGIRNIPYFSPEFFEILRFTAECTKKLGMRMDLTPGSSWPFGGPFVPKEYAPLEVTFFSIDVYGPCRFSYDFTNQINGEIEGIILGRMDKGRMCAESVRDLKKQVKPKELFGWPWGQCLDEIEIPEGLHKIVAIVMQDYRQTVGIPTREAGGYAIDHCRKEVTDFFFQNAVAPIAEHLGKGSIHSFFCDSIELAGNNWTAGFQEEFQRRRGYDLAPWIYALRGEVDDFSEAVRYDYYLTMSELTLENFFREMTVCCHELGSTSRIQAHGTWADILKAYGCADIPEGETFGEKDRLEVNSIHRRFASSAAHIYGKKVVSNESFTWLRMPRFLETLENIKAAADAIFLDGINAIVNHGYAYCPKEEQQGWPFYASSNICEHSSYWPYYGEIARYLQRVSAVLQTGRPHCEVGIYLPQADVWAENPIANLHMGMKLQEYLGWDLADEIQKQGYYFDYLNDEALCTLGEWKDGLVICENRYQVILLPKCKRLPEETAKALETFVREGGILVALGNIPKKSCGLIDRKSREQTVQECMERLFTGEKGQFHVVGKGCAAWISGAEELRSCLDQVFLPDVWIRKGCETVGYVHRTAAGREIYFVSNISPQNQETEMIFRGKTDCPVIWDALSGEAVEAEFVKGNNTSCLKVNFAAFQSVFVVFGEEHKEFFGKRKKVAYEMFLDTPVHLSVPERQFQIVQKQAEFWNQYEKLRYYSGQGRYCFSVWCEEKDPQRAFSDILLKFEKLGDIARVTVNGKECGTIWKRPYQISVWKAIQEGENKVEVLVTNRMINEAIDPQRPFFSYPGETMDGWPYFTETINQIRKKRIDCWRERAMIKEEVDSGIAGDISLCYLKNDEECL
jgi:hypothetical protein